MKVARNNTLMEPYFSQRFKGTHSWNDWESLRCCNPSAWCMNNRLTRSIILCFITTRLVFVSTEFCSLVKVVAVDRWGRTNTLLSFLVAWFDCFLSCMSTKDVMLPYVSMAKWTEFVVHVQLLLQWRVTQQDPIKVQRFTGKTINLDEERPCFTVCWNNTVNVLYFCQTDVIAAAAESREQLWRPVSGSFKRTDLSRLFFGNTTISAAVHTDTCVRFGQTLWMYHVSLMKDRKLWNVPASHHESIYTWNTLDVLQPSFVLSAAVSGLLPPSSRPQFELCCFRMVDELLSFVPAELNCTERGGNVAAVLSPTVSDAFLDYVRPSAAATSYIWEIHFFSAASFLLHN